METFQIGIEDLTIDQDGAVNPKNSARIAGQFQQLLVGQAVNQFGLLIANVPLRSFLT